MYSVLIAPNLILEYLLFRSGMCGKKNHEQISQFSVKDADNYEKYEQELEKFVEAVDPLLGR